jgi:hypothetical protein
VKGQSEVLRCDFDLSSCTNSLVGTRVRTNQMPTAPKAVTATLAMIDGTCHRLQRQPSEISVTTKILMRRGIPKPARYSPTNFPMPGRFNTQASSLGLERAKQAAAAIKNTVLGSTGRIAPRKPRPTQKRPNPSQNQLRGPLKRSPDSRLCHEVLCWFLWGFSRERYREHHHCVRLGESRRKHRESRAARCE